MRVPASTLRSIPTRFPLLLIENRGQASPAVAYYAPGRGRSVGFTHTGLVWSLEGPGGRRTVLQDFQDPREGARPEARDRRETVFSWFRRPPEESFKGVPSFGTVVYRDLWPGIDMMCTAEPARLKTTYLVRPGADPGLIRFRYRGAESVRLSVNGALRVTTAGGSFEDEAPVAWQERDGRRIPVAAAWDPGPADGTGAVSSAFRWGTLDPTLPLVIDPAVAMEAAYIGGFDDDGAAGVAVDGEGNALVAGITHSTAATFPVAVGPDLTLNGSPPDIYGRHDFDAFVAKVSADGTSLLFCGYIGGDGSEGATCIAVDGAGSAYVGGWEDATGNPGYNSDFRPWGPSTGFVVKVAPDGADLAFRVAIGGPGDASISAIAVDGAGRAWVAGSTYRKEDQFPVALGPDLTWNGGRDAFVARVAADGSGLEICGYLGGAGDDAATGIALDEEGNAIVAGTTGSSEGTFPVAVGPDLTFNGPIVPGDGSSLQGTDAFVAMVRADGGSLAYCGYIGGNADDTAAGVAVDAAGCSYVVGSTNSWGGTFPEAVGPGLEFHREKDYDDGRKDGFIAKVAMDGGSLSYCGYVAGRGFDHPFAVAVTPSGTAFVTGLTDSNEATLPVTGGPALVATGGRFSTNQRNWTEDVFVARVSREGAKFEFCGFLGGTASRDGMGMAIGAHGDLILVGTTLSRNSGFESPSGGALSAPGGELEAFLVRIPSDIPADPRDLLLHPAAVHIRQGGTRNRSRDSLSARGTFVVTGGPPEGDLDPRTGGLVFGIAGFYPNARLVVPSGDPGWRVDRRGVQTWRSPRGRGARWRVWLDPVAGAFDVRATRADLYFDWRDSPNLYLSADGVSGFSRITWERRGWRAVRFRRSAEVGE